MDFTLDADALKEQVEEINTPVIHESVAKTSVRKMREYEYDDD